MQFYSDENQSYFKKKGMSDWDNFYNYSRVLLLRAYSKKRYTSGRIIRKLEKAYLKLSLEQPSIKSNQYESMLLRLIDILNKDSIVIDKNDLTISKDGLMGQFYNPN